MIKLIENRVAIAPIENPDRIGHIIVPEMAKDRLNQGFVKYKGPDVKDLEIGDYCFFSGYTGTLMHVEGEGKFIIMPEEFVQARLKIPADGYEIPGLFFKSHTSQHQAYLNLREIILEILPDLELDAASDLAKKLSLKGVTERLSQPYFQANYEQAMNYIAMAFSENQEWRDRIKVVNRQPESSDYDKLKAGAGAQK